MRDLSLGLLSLGLGLTEHDEIVGVAYEAIAELVELPIQIVQDDVGQQRTGDSSYTVDNLTGQGFRAQRRQE